MPTPFVGSPRPTLGVELELSIVDRELGALADAALPVLEELGRPHPEGAHPRIKPELYACTVEVITGICDTVADARADLVGAIGEVRALLAPDGLDLVALGMHPFGQWRELTCGHNDRHRRLVEDLQWPVRRLLSHGMHVHVGVRDGDRALAIINRLLTHLPVLLALSASSPYRNGEDTGLASSRIKVMESLPRSGPPPELSDWQEFETVILAMQRGGAISTVRELWWDVRPHPSFGTVEVRIFDVPATVSEAMALAALTQCLLVWLDRSVGAGEQVERIPDWAFRENKWRATRHGVDAELIVDREGSTRSVAGLVGQLLETLTPVAAELGCSAELASVADLLARPSYARQRAVVGSGGSLVDVVLEARREFVDDLA